MHGGQCEPTLRDAIPSEVGQGDRRDEALLHDWPPITQSSSAMSGKRLRLVRLCVPSFFSSTTTTRLYRPSPGLRPTCTSYTRSRHPFSSRRSSRSASLRPSRNPRLLLLSKSRHTVAVDTFPSLPPAHLYCSRPSVPMPSLIFHTALGSQLPCPSFNPSNSSQMTG